jgi:hypothetical protein
MWVDFLPLMKMSILHFSFIGKVFPKAISKELMFMQVTEDPVYITQEKFLFPVRLKILDFALSPLKDIMFSKSLLQVAMDTLHKLKINCGMMLGA